jgi:hypothetical protein
LLPAELRLSSINQQALGKPDGLTNCRVASGDKAIGSLSEPQQVKVDVN